MARDRWFGHADLELALGCRWRVSISLTLTEIWARNSSETIGIWAAETRSDALSTEGHRVTKARVLLRNLRHLGGHVSWGCQRHAAPQNQVRAVAGLGGPVPCLAGAGPGQHGHTSGPPWGTRSGAGQQPLSAPAEVPHSSVLPRWSHCARAEPPTSRWRHPPPPQTPSGVTGTSRASSVRSPRGPMPVFLSVGCRVLPVCEGAGGQALGGRSGADGGRVLSPLRSACIRAPRLSPAVPQAHVTTCPSASGCRGLFAEEPRDAPLKSQSCFPCYQNPPRGSEPRPRMALSPSPLRDSGTEFCL